MGICNGRDEAVLTLSDNVKMLQKELQTIKDLDKNKDGVVTKDEILLWQKEQKNKMQILEERIENELSQKYVKLIQEKETALISANSVIEELTKQLNAAKNICTGLEQQMNKPDTINSVNHVKTLSKERVNEFVEKLLADESVNISYLPDFVEKQIYKNTLNLLIGLLNNTLNTASLNIIGHQLTFSINPLDQTTNV
jgi:hypothetical protein